MASPLTIIHDIKQAVIPANGRGAFWRDININPTDWRTCADPPALLTGATAPQLDSTVSSLLGQAARVLFTAVDADSQGCMATVRIPNDLATIGSGTSMKAQGLRVAFDLQTVDGSGNGGGTEGNAVGFRADITCLKVGAYNQSDPGVFTPNWGRIIDIDTGNTVASLSTTAAGWETATTGTWALYQAAYTASKRMLWVWDFSNLLDDNSKGIGPGDLLVVTLRGINDAGATAFGSQHLLAGAFVQYKSNLIPTNKYFNRF